MRHLFLSPHFDDAIGSCGGIMWRLNQRGRAVTLATVFGGTAEGALSPLAERLHDEWNLEDAPAARKAEDAEACAVLGCSQVVLDFAEAIYRCDPAGGHLYRDIRSLLGGLAEEESALADGVAAALTELCAGSDVLVHCPTADGGHPDHVAVHHAGLILESRGIPVIYYRSFYYDHVPGREKELGLEPLVTKLSNEEAGRKLLAFSKYQSQITALFQTRQAMESDFAERGGSETVLMPRDLPQAAAPEVSEILDARELPEPQAAQIATDEPAPTPEKRAFPAQHFEDYFRKYENPWDYASDYEQAKYGQTLSLIPVGPIKRGLEIGCAEGHFTLQLAPFVGHLTACDVSATALERAARRCSSFPEIEFRTLDIVEDPIAGPFELIVCSELLYYVPEHRLPAVAAKIADALAPGGHLLTAHANLLSDDRLTSGFDGWDSRAFGARTIFETFSTLGNLALVRVLRTPLYSVALFRRTETSDRDSTDTDIEIIDVPLVPLPAKVSRDVVWDGAIVTRQEARARETTGVVPVLMYHSITDHGPTEYAPYRVSPAAFQDQLRTLARHGYHALSLGAWTAAVRDGRRLPGRPVVITFDDGYLDFMDHALPILVEHGFSATVFVVTDRVGGVSEWDAELLPTQPLMGWEELRTLLANGISVASHGASHKDLLTLSDDEIRAEGERSRKALAVHLDLDATLFSYPWGRNDERVRRVISECGYTGAVATSTGVGQHGGPSTLTDNPMAIQRIEIAGEDTAHGFLRKLWIGGPRLRYDMTAANAEVASRKRHPGNAWARLAEQRDRILPEARTQGELWMPSDLDLRLEMSARLDALISEFVALQSELLKTLGPPYPLQKRISALFSAPLRNVEAGKPRRYAEASSGVRFGFDENGDVEVDVQPKADLSASPDHCLNTLHIRSKQPGNWFAIEISLDWVEINQAKTFQVGLYGRPVDQQRCDATLRLRRTNGKFHDVPLGMLTLEPEGRSAHVSDALNLPDLSDPEADLDLSSRPILIFYFRHESVDMDLTLDHIAAYFA